MTNQTFCPCSPSKPYDDCCGKYIEGHQQPQTAEQLMRSRYTAFVMQNCDYLLSSWHSDTCPEELEFDKDCRWLGLKIVNAEAGKSTDTEGTVHFVARYKIAGKAYRIEENSLFKRFNQQWLYDSAITSHANFHP
jgi:SEC-C motif-containing protein